MENKSSMVGIIWVVLGLIFVAAMYFSDWNEKVIMGGALIYALVAVTASIWAPKVSGKRTDS